MSERQEAAIERRIRYGDYARAVTVQQRVVSFNRVVSAADYRTRRGGAPLGLDALDLYRVLLPYVGSRFRDQVRAVVPLAVYLASFQLLILRTGVADAWVIAGGLFAVIVGLMLFLEGLRQGLMPFGETIGSVLPKKMPLPVVLAVTFLLGIGVTWAEPAIGALKTAGSRVSPEAAPYLFVLLTEWSGALVLVVGAGVGLAACLGTLRFLYGWSLKPLVYAALAPALGLTLWLFGDPELSKTIGLAWDCGAVTTGPVTVPLVLSLGIGVAAAAGKADSGLSGFGIVTLASLFPIIGVMGLALYVSTQVSPEQILAAAAPAVEVDATGAAASFWEVTPGVEIALGVRAVLPLVLFLLLVMKGLLREKIRSPRIITYGIALCLLGMVVFNLGLSYGLVKLGSQSGGLVPAAFLGIDVVPGSPLYERLLGIGIAVAFACVLGLAATLAEPALNALGMTVEQLTDGAFKRSRLMHAVALGVGVGIAVGLVKIMFALPLAWLLVPAYALALLLTALSSEEFVNVAWDSAGVTTGPVTVPLVLAMGLGFGGALDVVDGFGILAMASIGPILSVLTLGLWTELSAHRRHLAADRAASEAEAA